MNKYRETNIRGNLGNHFPDLLGYQCTRVRIGPKIGRNEKCLCGSGKKYKKCCLGKEENDG